MAENEAGKKRNIEQYDHKDKKRVNNPPVGLVMPPNPMFGTIFSFFEFRLFIILSKTVRQKNRYFHFKNGILMVLPSRINLILDKSEVGYALLDHTGSLNAKRICPIYAEQVQNNKLI